MELEATDKNFVDEMIKHGQATVEKSLALLRAHTKKPEGVLNIEAPVASILCKDINAAFLTTASQLEGYKTFTSAFNTLSPQKQAELAKTALDKILDTCRKKKNTVFLSAVVRTPA